MALVALVGLENPAKLSARRAIPQRPAKGGKDEDRFAWLAFGVGAIHSGRIGAERGPQFLSRALYRD